MSTTPTGPNVPIGQRIAVTDVEAAELLGCSRQHVRKLVARGELRLLNIGTSRSTRIPVVDLYRILGLDPERDAIGGGK